MSAQNKLIHQQYLEENKSSKFHNISNICLEEFWEIRHARASYLRSRSFRVTSGLRRRTSSVKGFGL